jgi:hypothetical protein
MPVGTHTHLLVVGVGNLIAVLGLARLGARRGEIRRGFPKYGKPKREA